MNQEKLMKRRMIRAIVLLIITFIALLVFIGLYVDETRRVQETYRKQYKTSLNGVVESMTSDLDNDGVHDLRYARILSDMSSANSFAFLIDSLSDDQKKTINELHACIMKYPEQMSERFEETRTAINDIIADTDKGYEEAAAVVDSVDKQGN